MATADVLRDMGDTLVYLLRAGIPGSIVDPANIFVATPDEFMTSTRRPSRPSPSSCTASRSTRRCATARAASCPTANGSRPLLPLELSYLITPWAKETRDEFRIAGRVLQVLYDRAELGPADLQGTSWAADDSVQLVLESIPLEEHLRIWDTTELPYRLSLTYQARVVGLEPAEAEEVPPVAEAIFGETVMSTDLRRDRPAWSTASRWPCGSSTPSPTGQSGCRWTSPSPRGAGRPCAGSRTPPTGSWSPTPRSPPACSTSP
jgi:hypothetical protein